MDQTALIREVERYYTAKIKTHGATPRGVDWNSTESQVLRYAQMAKILDESLDGSITDVGCGYGGFLSYLRAKGFRGRFTGVDISADMVAAAKAQSGGDDKADFVVGELPPHETDFVAASGIFSVRQTQPDRAWRDYILATLDGFNRVTRRGFVFNCLTSYSDPEKMRADLYYADPLALFDHCKRSYAKNVALLHDYGLYEFTILVRK